MPSTRSVPALTGEVAPSIRIVEDFPAPFGPRKPNTSPRPNSKSIPSTARNGGAPFRARYVFVRPLASTRSLPDTARWYRKATPDRNNRTDARNFASACWAKTGSITCRRQG